MKDNNKPASKIINDLKTDSFQSFSKMTPDQGADTLISAAKKLDNNDFSLAAAIEGEVEFENLLNWQKELLVVLIKKSNPKKFEPFWIG